MNQKNYVRTIAVCLFTLAVFLGNPSKGYCKYDVDWGISLDNGLHAPKDTAKWLFNNGYFADMDGAQNFADNGYIGHNASDPDPSYWNISQPVTFQVVQEIAAFSDMNKLGYYTKNGDSKTLTQIFGGRENGPQSFSIDQPFGLYLRTPQMNTWFTDRGLDLGNQHGDLIHDGGSAQAVVYELQKGSQWLVAWEDLDASKTASDRDYNDMFCKVTTAPEPVSSALLLLGGGALTMARIKKNRAALAVANKGAQRAA